MGTGAWRVVQIAVVLAVVAVIGVFGRQYLPGAGGGGVQTVQGIATMPVLGPVPSVAAIVVDNRWIYLFGIVAPREEPDCTVAGVTYQCTLVAVAKAAELVAGHEVRCQVRHRQYDERNWGLCWMDGVGKYGNPEDSLNAQLVRVGWAFVAPQTKDFAADLRTAQRNKAGMWIGEAFSHPDFLKGPLVGESENADGMTAEIREVRIKLFGIDAPALGQECTIKAHTYPCGFMSHEYLNNLTAGNQVSCDIRQRPGDERAWGVCTQRNPASRQLSPITFNEQMVRAGWAIADRTVSLDYVEAENDARANKRGLWQGEFVNPTEWRNGKR